MIAFLEQYFKIFPIIILIYIMIVIVATITMNIFLQLQASNFDSICTAIITISGIIFGFVFNAFIQLGSSSLGEIKYLTSEKTGVTYINLIFYKLTFTMITCVICIVLSMIGYLSISLVVYINLSMMIIQLISLLHALTDYLYILRQNTR